MPNHSAVSLFSEVVRLGSFSRVARKFGKQPSSVSRLIGSLEKELETQLFHRSTRQLKLTDAGQLYYERLVPILTAMDDVHRELAEYDSEPRGLLRLTAPTEFARIALAPLFRRFLAEYPEVHIDLIVQDSYLDLIREGIDLAVRFGRLGDTNMIARRLGPDPMVLCASKQYLAGNFPPKATADLKNHNCLQFRPTGEAVSPPRVGSRWSLWKGLQVFEVETCGNVISNSVGPLIEAALDGLGIVIAPAWSVKEHLDRGALIEVLPEYEVGWDEGERAIHAVYPPTQYLPRKVRSFIDFLVVEFNAPGRD